MQEIPNNNLSQITKLEQEKEQFLRFTEKLDAQVASGDMTDYEREFLIQSTTHNINRKEYITALNTKILQAKESFGRDRKSRSFKQQKVIVASAALLVIILACSLILTNTSFTGLFIYTVENSTAQDINQTFTAGVHEYPLELGDGIITSLHVDAKYDGEFKIWLVNDNETYLVYDATDAQGLTGITGFSVHDTDKKDKNSDDNKDDEDKKTDDDKKDKAADKDKDDKKDKKSDRNETAPPVNETINETEIPDEIINETIINNTLPSQNETINETLNETIIPDEILNETINETISNETIIQNETLNETIINNTLPSQNETINETLNETIIPDEILNETITNETTSNETINQTIISNETISNETLPQINETINETLNETIIPDEIINETINETISNETINEIEIPLTRELLIITNGCKDTCSVRISPKNISLRIEVADEGILNLERIIYTQETAPLELVQTANISTIDLYTSITIDLSQYFSDENSAGIIFDSNTIPGIAVSIEGSQLTYSLQENYSYQESYDAFIYATNGKSIITSNTFKIRIRPAIPTEELFNVSYNETVIPNITISPTNTTITPGTAIPGANGTLINGELMSFTVDESLKDMLAQNISVKKRIIIKYVEQKDVVKRTPQYIDELKANFTESKILNTDDYNITSLEAQKTILETQASTPVEVSGNLITGNVISNVVTTNISADIAVIDQKIVEAKFAEKVLNATVDIKQATTDFDAVEMDVQNLDILKLNPDITAIYVDNPVSALVINVKNHTGVISAQEEYLNTTGNVLNGSGVKICIVDTGVNSVVVKNYVYGFNVLNTTAEPLDDHGHGTAMGSLIDDIAPGAQLIAVKALNNLGEGYESDIIAGLEYCGSQNVSIISLSIGEGAYPGYCVDNLVAQEVDALTASGILVIAASGNDGSTTTIKSPACSLTALPITASDENDTIASLANYNSGVALTAPGVDIPAKSLDGGDIIVSGTSASTAIVAGISALIMQGNADFSSGTILEKQLLLIQTGTVIEYAGRNFSRINAYNALTNNYTNTIIPNGNQTNVSTNETFKTLVACAGLSQAACTAECCYYSGSCLADAAGTGCDYCTTWNGGLDSSRWDATCDGTNGECQTGTEYPCGACRYCSDTGDQISSCTWQGDGETDTTGSYKCSTCQKCASGYCANQASNEDLASECNPSYNDCSSTCTKIGPDGLCSGTAASCKATGQSTTVAVGKVCSGGSEVDATNSGLACDSDTNYYASANACSYQPRYSECDAIGTCDTSATTNYYSPTTITVSANYVATASSGGTSVPTTPVSSSYYCGTDTSCGNGACVGTTYYRGCVGTSAACKTDNTGAASADNIYASAGYSLTGACGTTGATNCDATNRCSTAAGDNYYNTGSTNGYAQGMCDGSGTCDYVTVVGFNSCGASSSCTGGACALNSGQVCTVNGDCYSGYCRADYSGGLSYCAPDSTSCMHSATSYASGAYAPDCVSVQYRRVCSSGSWAQSTDCYASDSCSDTGTSNGGGTCSANRYSCSSGSCSASGSSGTDTCTGTADSPGVTYYYCTDGNSNAITDTCSSSSTGGTDTCSKPGTSCSATNYWCSGSPGTLDSGASSGSDACGGVGSPYTCQKTIYSCTNTDAGSTADTCTSDTTSITSGYVCTGSGTETLGSSTYYCGLSSFNGCSGDLCDKKQDYLACSGSNTCTVDVGDSFTYTSAGYYCSSGSEVSGDCDSTPSCSGGSYYTGHTCTGSGSCTTDTGGTVYDSTSTGCAYCGYTWYANQGTNELSTPNCCGDDAGSDSWDTYSGSKTTSTSLTCYSCNAGSAIGGGTYYGNGNLVGAGTSRTCYYGDITCAYTGGGNGASATIYGWGYYTGSLTASTSVDCKSGAGTCTDGNGAGNATDDPSSTLYGNGQTTGSVTTDTSLTCYYGDITCASGSEANGAFGTYYGNGYYSGSLTATTNLVCYYGDITCADNSAINGDSTTIYGNGYYAGSLTTSTSTTCYYGDLTCNNGGYGNGTSSTIYGNGYYSGSLTVDTSILCYYTNMTCSDGSSGSSASGTYYGNGNIQGSGTSRTCYYGDITCADESAAHGTSASITGWGWNDASPGITTDTTFNCQSGAGSCSNGGYGNDSSTVLYGNGYTTGSTTVDTSLLCYYSNPACSDGVETQGASGTYYGNGYYSGSLTTTTDLVCYYGDITCADESASNGTSSTIYGNGYYTGSLTTSTSIACYYGDLTCNNGAGSNGTLGTYYGNGYDATGSGTTRTCNYGDISCADGSGSSGTSSTIYGWGYYTGTLTTSTTVDCKSGAGTCSDGTASNDSSSTLCGNGYFSSASGSCSSADKATVVSGYCFDGDITCSSGSEANGAVSGLLLGNGNYSGSLTSTTSLVCYYGDITCADGSSGNGTSATIYGNGYASADKTTATSITCYYGDLTCNNGAGSDGTSGSYCGNGYFSSSNSACTAATKTTATSGYCYYNDITCADGSASNSAVSGILYGNGNWISTTCYYGDITCTDGTNGNGTSASTNCAGVANCCSAGTYYEGASCSDGTTAAGTAYDKDTSQTRCEYAINGCTGYYWNIGGEINATACCTDDAGENKITRTCGSSVCTTNSSDDGCCDASTDCVYASTCYANGYNGNPSSDGTNESCSSGTWIDGQAPAIGAPTLYSGTYTSSGASGAYFKGTVSARVTISDTGGGGLKSGSCQISIGGGGWTATGVTNDSSYCYYDSYNPGASFTIAFRMNDTLDNVGTSTTSTFTYDVTAPVTSATGVKADGSSYTFGAQASTAYVNVTLSCVDTGGSGCSVTQYCTDTANTCTPTTVYSTPVQITFQGTSYIRYFSNDSVNNIESTANKSIILNTAPELSSIVLSSTSGLNLTSDNLTVSFTATDADSDAIYNTTDWRRNSVSIAVLNMPFNLNTSSTTTGAIADFSTFANNGTLGGGTAANAPTYTTGKVGGAYDFDRINDYISVPAVLSGNDPFTAMAWINPREVSTAWKTVFAEGCTGFDLNINSGTIYFGRNCGGGNGFYSGPTVSAGTWTHLVIVFNGTNLDLYKNNVKTTGGASTYTHAALYIGSYNGADELFNGSIDEVLIFNRSLSAEEISAIYTAQNAGKAVTTMVSQELASGDQWQVLVAASDQKSYTTGTSNTLTTSNVNCSTPIQANTVYTLTSNATISGATCFTITAANVTLDCNGYSITGNNTVSTYGVYSTAYNTTVKNCYISNFLGGILGTATYLQVYNTITNISINNGGARSIQVSGANSVLNNVTAWSSGSSAEGLLLDAANITVSNAVTGGGTGGAAFYMTSAVTSGTFTNISAYATSQYAARSGGASNIIFNNLTMTSTASHGFTFSSASPNITINGLTASITGAYSAIYNDNAANMTINCSGGNIIGSNSTGAYGIYSNQYNTTIRNCNISNFQYGVYFNGATYSTIQNTNASTTYSTGTGIYLNTNSNYNTITNNVIYSSGYYAFVIVSASNNIIQFNNVSSSSLAGYIRTGSYNTFANNNFTSTGSYGFWIEYNSFGNNLTRNYFYSGSSNAALYFYTSGANNNIVYNNTMSAPSGSAIYITSSSGNNTFYWNNITNTGSWYIYDANGTNLYNTTIGGNGEGNIYPNVISGAVEITGTATSGYGGGLYIGTAGSGYPYNSSTSQGKISGTVYDYAPLTSQQTLTCSALSTANTVYTMTANANITGATCFNVTAANVTLNCNGYSITGNNVTGTYGVYSNQFNTTVKNCNISNFATGIYFNGATNGTISNSTASTTRGGSATDGFGIYLFTSANYNTISNSAGTSASYFGIRLYSSSNNNIINSNGTSGSNVGILISSNSNNNNFTGTIGNSTSSNAIYIDGGSNVLIDCQGRNIIGTNTTGTYGIYSNQFNTTVKNCNISNFQHGVYTTGSTARIENVYAATTAASGNGIFTSGAYTNVINSTGISAAYAGIWTQGTSSNFTDVTGQHTASDNYEGIIFDTYNINSNIICTRCTGLTTAGQAIHIRYAGGVTLNNCTGTASTNGDGLRIMSGAGLPAGNSVIANSTFKSATGYAIRLMDNGGGGTQTSSIFYNNTLNSTGGANTLLYLSASAGNNTFYWNNFTSTSGYYVQDLNGSNYYNTTISGTPAGNIYANVIDGSVDIAGNVSSPFSGLYYGNAGFGYPYSTATSLGKLSGTITDYGPLTTSFRNGTCMQLNTANTVYTLTSNAAINGATCFTIAAANVTLNCAGYNITGSNITGIYGIYSNQYNTTIKNCNVNGFDWGIYFLGATYGTIDNTTASSSYSTGRGMGFQTSSNNLITNSTGISSTHIAIQLYSNSNNNQFIGTTTTTGTTANSHGIYISGGINNLIDCQGRNIVGTNASGTYGIYSDQVNTTIKNCIISNFSSAIYYNGATSGLVQNNNVTSTFATGYGIAMTASSNANQIIGNNATTDGYSAIFISSSNSNSLSNNIAYRTGSSSYAGIYIVSSNSNNLTNNIGYGGANPGIQLYSASNNLLINNTGNSTGSTGLSINTNSNTNTVINSTGISTTGYGIFISAASDNNNLTGTTSTSNSSHAIYISGGSNVLIDCQGRNIIGTNTSSTYGIYSNQFNTTIKNCNISNFATGIYFLNAANGTITSNTVSSSRAYTLPGGIAVLLSGTSNYNTVANNTITKLSDIVGLMLYNGASYNTIQNNSVTAASGYAIYSEANCNNNIFSSNIASTSSDYAFIISGANNTAANNSLTATGISLFIGNTGISNSIYNNTLAGNPEVKINTGGNSNTFYWNNFTSTSGYYVQDLNGSNFYNTSVTGVAQGNYYSGISALSIYDTNSNGWGDSGSDYPLSATTWASKWSGGGTDYGPYTTNTGTLANTMLGNATSWSWANSGGIGLVRSGNATNWTWRAVAYGSGRQIVNGTATNWTWRNE